MDLLGRVIVQSGDKKRQPPCFPAKPHMQSTLTHPNDRSDQPTELRRGTLEHSSSSNGPKKWRNSGGHDYFRIQTVKNECKALGAEGGDGCSSKQGQGVSENGRVNIIPNPSYVVHNSCQTCRIFYHIHSHHYTIILNQDKFLGNHQTSKSQDCLAQLLAQAEGSRSGETCSLRRASPSPRREHKNRSKNNAGSHLSEISLAWASCLLAQKLNEPPG
ncbi:hypothetical protein DEO72_LG1g3319 [Vigna unguiculata]|uniref:Uncharacterized protein n=1 Tax=Vigna unguiculata TaxID=3917 RepID=A0A4D6KQ31_VIGUN|nr:hypothetical protein DEO72_LG1g3319 [Vigna unguiculata]